MAKQQCYSLCRDKKGIVWDILLYLPTVVVLGLIAANFWYGGEHGWAYLLLFLASYFGIAGLNRIAMRLLLSPKSPVSMELDNKGARLRLKSGDSVDLVKELRFFSDYAGKSFGLTGRDLQGKKHQYVFHRGQFASESDFKGVSDLLKVFS